MILVNKYGVRVVDEKRNYHDRTRVHFTWDANEAEYPNRLLFMVYDSRTADLFAGNFPLPAAGSSSPHVISAPTLGALANAIQTRLGSYHDEIGPYPLSPEFSKSLAAEVKRFGQDAKSGKDSRFARGNYPYDTEWQNINSVPRESSGRPKNSGPNPT